ncbi:MAG: hypothetical protein JW774_03390 [Candidatus Aureabacteria bacterium]|nr:hypothetical protein [Candidatus Auribacterota bacterium]
MDQIKKYMGSNMSEILDRVRAELGQDAMILRSLTKPKKINGSVEFEVIAGAGHKSLQSAVSIPKPHLLKVKKEYESNLPKERERTAKEIESLHQEIQNLKLCLETVFQDKAFPESMKMLRGHLLNNGADRDATDRFTQSLTRILGARAHQIDSAKCLKVARALIEKGFGKKISGKTGTKRIRALVGPTGAGKTTTLAKLASIAVLEEKKDVVLVSLDDYRLGAHAQLKAYADILSVSFYTFSSPLDLKKFVQILPPSISVYVDTSGVSPMNSMGIKKITSFLSGIGPVDISLVVQAGLPWLDFQSILLKFKMTGYHNLILTKIDEMNYWGNWLSLCLFDIPPLEYLTNGQEVPKDIMRCSPSFMAEKILQV